MRMQCFQKLSFFQGPLLWLLTDRELKGVIAHEIGHLRSDDCLYLIFFQSVIWLPGKLCSYVKKILSIISFVIRFIDYVPAFTAFIPISAVFICMCDVIPAGLCILAKALLFFIFYPAYHWLNNPSC